MKNLFQTLLMTYDIKKKEILLQSIGIRLYF